MPRLQHEDKKKQKEWDKKVDAIKSEVRKRVPELQTKVPNLPPRIGTLDFVHLTHPFMPVSNSPNIIGRKVNNIGEELKKELRMANKAKKKNKKRDDSDSHSDSSDDVSLPYVRRKAAENARFEDFVIPDVLDAETGEELVLTRATWSTDEGRVNEDIPSLLNRGLQSLKIKNRPDSSHRIVPILSPRQKTKMQKAGKKVLNSLMFKTRKKAGGDNEENQDDGSEEVTEEFTATNTQSSQVPKESMLFKLKKQATHDNIVHETKKYMYYDETREITDDSAEFWKKNKAKVSVHHYDHLLGGLTKEEIAEKEHHNSMHRLKINLRLDKDGQHAGDHHKGGIKLHHHNHHTDEDARDENIQHRHAHKKLHPLVAAFMRDGPQQPMYHKFWDKRVDAVVVPKGYINDEDDDARSYLSYDDKKLSHEKLAKLELPLVAGAGADGDGTARSTTSSIGFDSVESIMKDKNHPDNKKRTKSGKGELSAELERTKKDDALLKVGKNEDEDEESMSVLSDALDPNNEVSWRALEDRYYFEIRAHALDYESNKLWTKEKEVKGGVGGMDIAIRAYANWKMRSIKFIVQAIDDEEKKEVSRLALEDELEINKPERLLDQVKLHNEERHKHRTYIKTFKYDIEIVSLKKLNDLGLVW